MCLLSSRRQIIGRLEAVVTILVDGAAWSWRGERWAHLVSDVSYEELHRFAADLGLERRWFQGDHYDVPVSVRAAAIAAGAQPVSSAELVRRLRAAGLRRGSRVGQLPSERTGSEGPSDER